MNFLPVQLGPEHASLYSSHMRRHRAESGKNGFHFMPFHPDDKAGPSAIDLNRLALPTTTPGWQRSFMITDNKGNMVAHIHLKNNPLQALSHRCTLELGIESNFRRQGLGTLLCRHAIRYARNELHLDWIDLCTFAHNTPARALYTKLGFVEIGVVHDKFRIGELSIADVQMCLALRDHKR